jgi:type III secretion system YscQ/HrcQ family protein
LLETLRRAARGEAPELIPDTPPANDWLLSGTATLRLGGKPYRLELLVEALDGAPRPTRPARVCLTELGAVRLRVPWVCAVSSATLGELERLAVGDVWLPGNDGWLAGEPALSVGLLAPARAERGIPVRVSGGRTVLGAQAVAVIEERDASMGQDESELEELVGTTPLVVRLELGSMEMSAAEWAALRPGDVLQSGRRIDETVTLRTGGREIARGELVEIDGEIGVRITQVGLAKDTP